ncbi:ABC transporter ATP-binding protein [Gordonia hydrophobica]|uniref:ABC transporter ATP-binding protein n=1 Tax=Gordonia hydrophobica TaxID=40516 RepID=A0ABZ2U0N2_9ACTN|nr:ABC transporter ATP-binding protein [Gordonia hydrophobica]MBM7367760.1 iron complex transport system ATP-binding protein [Gordonia hydrophobica]
MTIEVSGIDFAVEHTAILRDVSCTAPTGAFTGIIGPNGSGKSTLLSMIMRWQQPDSGRVLLDGRDVRGIGRREFARSVAEVEQQSTTVLELTVEQIVELGTIPRSSGWGRPLGEASTEVDDAIEALGLASLRRRTWHTLSGGERQKVQVARALAQRPDVLVLDEPTNHLDVAAGLHLLGLTRQLGLTVVAAIHDLNLAAMFCDRLVVLQEGAVCAEGAPTEVLTPDLLAAVYGIEAQVLVHPATGGPLVVPCATIDAAAPPNPNPREKADIR